MFRQRTAVLRATCLLPIDCCTMSTRLHELLLVLSPAGPSSSQELPAEFSGTVIGPAAAYCLLRHFISVCLVILVAGATRFPVSVQPLSCSIFCPFEAMHHGDFGLRGYL